MFGLFKSKKYVVRELDDVYRMPYRVLVPTVEAILAKSGWRPHRQPEVGCAYEIKAFTNDSLAMVKCVVGPEIELTHLSAFLDALNERRGTPTNTTVKGLVFATGYFDADVLDAARRHRCELHDAEALRELIIGHLTP